MKMAIMIRAMGIGSILFLMVSFSSLANAESHLVKLEDGSQIQGEVVGMKNGQYMIRRESLGTIYVDSAKVHSISKDGGIRETDTASEQNLLQQMAGSQMQSIQQSLLGNAELVGSIMSLQSNPDMQAVLNDPEVMAMVQRFDFEALRNNPKIQKLMGNAEVQKIQASAAP